MNKNNRIKNTLPVFSLFVVRSWWVLPVLVCVYVVYVKAVEFRKIELSSLVSRSSQLKLDRECIKQEVEELQARVLAQRDPAFIELLLMEGLGVVPEGQTKVYFKKRE